MKALTEQEFHDTFTDEMLEIDFDSTLLEMELISDRITMAVPYTAYRNSTATYEHHLLETEIENVFLVFVKDLTTGVVDYHLLDTNEQQGCCGGGCGCGG